MNFRDTVSAPKLFCLPYAGGSAGRAFKNWPSHINGVEICPLDFPGHGTKIGANPESCAYRLAQIMSLEIRQNAVGPFGIYGHSMGALIAFECARHLENTATPPMITICAARPAPHMETKNSKLHLLDDDDLIEELRRMGGTPEEVLAERDLLNWFLPIIRADFAVNGNYQFMEGKLKLDLHVIAAKNDAETEIERIGDWAKNCTHPPVFHHIEGEHFFLHDFPQELNIALQCALQPLARKKL